MDQSQQPVSTRDYLRTIRQEARATRSLETLRLQFEQLNGIRRQTLEDFDLQVMIADIHQEIIERARYLRGETPLLPAQEQAVVFQAPVTQETMELVPVRKPKAAAESEPAAATSKAREEEFSEAAEIPPEVTRVDPRSWQMILGLSAFVCLVVLVGFFYLIQTARKLNIEDETRAKAEQINKSKPKADTAGVTVAPVSISPTLRLYTDLAAATVTIDNQAPRNLTDGELLLDNLTAGQHSIKVAGTGGAASFEFEVTGTSAPKVIGLPQASNALAVLVSEQDGHGQLVTSGGRADVLLDGKSAGEADTAGLELAGLGTTDHDLQVVHDRDRQRFVMTYTPAPVLTVYVKSDSNTGILQVATGQDGVEIYIDNTLFRRKTEHGQVRISIRAGKYPIRVHKDGFIDPPASVAEVKKAEVTELKFDLSPIGTSVSVASLQIRGAQAGTTAYIDREFVAGIGPDGAARISNIKPGDHTIELRRDQAVTKRLQRNFRAGEVMTLAGPDVTLEKTSVETKPAVTPVSTPEDITKPSNAVAPNENFADGTRMQRGGGFVPYDTPKATGHYSFRTQGKVGGVLKKGKLQWYAGYEDSQNYILFSLDGKHAEVREMRNGKNILWNRVSCNIDSSNWVQVELGVKPGAVSARVKTGSEGWLDIGSVASSGRDFTQDKVGFYIPPNDEVAVANFKFANR